MMTLEEYNTYCKSKKTFKAFNSNEVRYTIDTSLEHLKSRFPNSDFSFEEVSEEEFLSNYSFETLSEITL